MGSSLPSPSRTPPPPSNNLYFKVPFFAFVVQALLYLLEQFLQVRGVTNLDFSRVLLFGMWLCVSLMIWGYFQNRGWRKRWRVTLAAIFAFIAVWVDQVVPQPPAPASAIGNARKPSEIELDAIRALDSNLAGKDEAALTQMFGAQEMWDINVRYQRENIAYTQKTGGTHLNWWPEYAGEDGTVTPDRQVVENKSTKRGGGVIVNLDAGQVLGVVVPNQYTDGKSKLAAYETSIGMPVTISAATKALREALEQNEYRLIQLLDEAMRRDKRYFVEYENTKSQFWHSLDTMVNGRFIPLQPMVEDIRLEARLVLGPPPLITPPKPQPVPTIEVGFALGAETVFDGNTACDSSPSFKCYSEPEVQGKSFRLDRSQWRRIIYRFRNLGQATVSRSHIHLESTSTGVSIFYGNQRDIARPANYVMEEEGGDIAPFSTSGSYTAFPVDLVVQEGVPSFDLRFKIFGGNMPAHEVTTHFTVDNP